MFRAYFMSLVAGAFLFTMAPLALTGRYDNIYASNLAQAHTYRSNKQARVQRKKQAWRQLELTPGELLTKGLVEGGWLPSMLTHAATHKVATFILRPNR